VKRYLLSLLVLFPISAFINAQEAEEENVEEVIVTGIKTSFKRCH
jgi:hypothetical protein